MESYVIDNGPGRGSRVVWVETGSGFRFKVAVDRGMDIADAFFNAHNLAWTNQTGVVPPQPLARGIDWLKGFGGGLLTTCGLAHVGGPESDEYGDRGVHGDYSNTAAEIESIIQPDPIRGRLEMSLTGIMRNAPIFGPALELRRTISCTLGSPGFRIHDEVSNIGNVPAPHMILYHCNFGWPLVDEGTRILWKGTLKEGIDKGKSSIYKDGHDHRTCPAPLDEHAGTGEAVGFIDPAVDAAGQCSCGLYHESIGLALSMRFRKDQLPWLTNWQHFGKGEYVTALEPGSNPPIGQAKAREQGTLDRKSVV
jgi:hypothetical protein